MSFCRSTGLTVEKKEKTGGRAGKYSLSWPFTSEKPYISEFYAKRAEAYEKNIIGKYERTFSRFPLNLTGGYEAEMSFHTGYNRNNMLSLCTDTYESAAPLRVRIFRQCETWDTERQQLLTYDKLFLRGRGFDGFIGERIRKEVQSQMKMCEGSYYYSLSKPVRWKWYLEDRGLAVWFASGEIGPDNGGMPLFLFKWEELEGFLRFEP